MSGHVEAIHHALDAFRNRQRGSVQDHMAAVVRLLAQISRPVHHLAVVELRPFPLEPQAARARVVVAIDKDRVLDKATGRYSSLGEERKASLPFKEEGKARFRFIGKRPHPLDGLGALPCLSRSILSDYLFDRWNADAVEMENRGRHTTAG